MTSLRETRAMNSDAWMTLLFAIVGGAVRVGTPFLFVSLGECLTEKSGRINLGLEGVLVLAAMAGFARLLPDRGMVAGRAAGAASAARCWRCCTACCARCRASATSPPASR